MLSGSCAFRDHTISFSIKGTEYAPCVDACEEHKTRTQSPKATQELDVAHNKTKNRTEMWSTDPPLKPFQLLK